MKNIMIATAAICTVFATGANAQCGASMAKKQTVIMPRLPAGVLTSDSPGTPDPANNTIAGLWTVTFVSGGQVVDEGFDQWNSDGTEVLNDTPPPSTGNVCLGVWIKSGPAYKLKHPSWTFDDGGRLNGTAIIREQVVLSPTGTSFMGPFTIDVYDMNGNLLYHLGGQVTGQRITVN